MRKIILILTVFILALLGFFAEVNNETVEEVYVPLVSIDGVKKNKRGIFMSSLLHSVRCNYRENNNTIVEFPCKVVAQLKLNDLSSGVILIGVDKEPNQCESGCTVVIIKLNGDVGNNLLLKIKNVVPPVNILTKKNQWNEIEVYFSGGSNTIFKYKEGDNKYVPI